MRTPARHGPAATTIAWRVASLLIVATLLIGAIAGGLLRAGVALPVPASAWPAQAVLAHAFLMMSAFMGTVIGIERAVAVKHRAAFIGPMLSALAGLAMLGAQPALAAWLAVAAALGFVIVNLVVVKRQPAAHTALLLVGGFALLAANLLLALGSAAASVIPGWFSFLVLTIAAERLEMTRLMRRRRGAASALYICLAALLLGAAGFALSPAIGALLFGAALLGLAIWLMAFDIARRTIAASGLSRYMAACLLLGYAWLAFAGAAWMATGLGLPLRDVALHALGLGFIFSMMLGHAPVILPAIARIKVEFGVHFYLPLALLHLSLALRLFAAPFLPAALRLGALGNALAIALFAMTMVGAALTWRARHTHPA
ncbi:MAG: hypothetical protein JSR38_06560 [Proteobacteria bacterium]|nr:hypothetical protein [Pseudomonadota bacterium]